ncbi:MAG: hypothetical protein NTX03_13545 [Bacteroidetes bacterium]|nr:hypothetical protein [Bacteroidota bacterium]
MPQTLEKIHEFTGHKDGIYSLVAADNEDSFFSAAGDGMVIKWNIKTAEAGLVVARLSVAIYSLAFLQNQNILFSGTRFGGLYRLDLNTQKQTNYTELEGDVFSLLLLNETELIAATGNGIIYKINTEDGSIIHQTKLSEKACRVLVKHPKENKIASGWSDNFIRIIDADSLELKAEILAHANSVFSLGYSPNGKYIFSGGRDAILNIFEEEILEKSNSLIAHLYTINDIQWQPNTKIFATASRDKTIKLWEAETLNLLQMITASTHSINKLLWVDNYLIAAGDDRKIGVYVLQ